MYNWDNYDNDMAYSYDDYVEENEDAYDDYVEENEDAYEDYLLQKQLEEKAEEFNSLEYESKMAEQLINDINEKM